MIQNNWGKNVCRYTEVLDQGSQRQLIKQKKQKRNLDLEKEENKILENFNNKKLTGNSQQEMFPN